LILQLFATDINSSYQWFQIRRQCNLIGKTSRRLTSKHRLLFSSQLVEQLTWLNGGCSSLEDQYLLCSFDIWLKYHIDPNFFTLLMLALVINLLISLFGSIFLILCYHHRTMALFENHLWKNLVSLETCSTSQSFKCLWHNIKEIWESRTCCYWIRESVGTATWAEKQRSVFVLFLMFRQSTNFIYLFIAI
jgi:hypothetical protein